MEDEHLTSRSFDFVKCLGGALMDSLSIEASSLDYTVGGANHVAIFDDTSRHLQCFHPENNTWTKMHELHPTMKKGNFSAITFHNNVFVLMQDKVVYRLKYADKSATWQRMSDMIEEHGQWPPAMSDSRHIYVAGYWGPLFVSQKTIEKFDILTDQWCQPSKHKVLQASSCVLYSKKIYCISGYENKQCVKTVEVYDLDSNKWNMAAPLLNNRCFAGAATICKKIFVAGGQNGTNVLDSVECFDPVCDFWTLTLLSPMISAQTGLPIFTMDDCIYYVGRPGYSPHSIQKYYVANDEWTETEILDEAEFKLLWPIALNIKPSN